MAKLQKVAYRAFLYSSLAFLISDALWGLLDAYHLVTALSIDTSIYFAAMAFTVLFWTLYVVAYLGDHNWFSRTLVIFGVIISILTLVFIIINIFNPILFQIHDDGKYEALSTRYALLALQLVMFVVTSLYAFIRAFQSRGSIKMKYDTVGFFGLAMAVAIVLQTFYPLLPIYAAGTTIAGVFLQTFVMQKEKAESSANLALVRTDPLTGARSRYAYVQAEEDIDKAINEKRIHEFAVVVFDINGLKDVNDRFGHESGDQYIKDCYELILSVYGGVPVYRFGGDEFVAILQNKGYERREELLQEIVTKVNENLKYLNKPVVSCGMSVFEEGVDNAYRAVFTRADMAMYDFKKNIKDKM